MPAIRVAERLHEFAKKAFAPGNWRIADAATDLETLNRIALSDGVQRASFLSVERLSSRIEESFRAGKTPDVEEDARDRFARLSKILDQNHPWVAASQIDLGLVYLETNQLDRAYQSFVSALEILSANHLTEHPDFARALRGYAWLMIQRGSLDVADPLLRKTLMLELKLLDPTDPTLIDSLRNLASVIQQRGSLSAAEELIDYGRDIAAKLRENREGVSATLLYNLGGIAKARGDFPKAELAYNSARVVFAKIGGDRHPGVVACLNNIGAVRKESGDYSGAATHFLMALSLYRAIPDRFGEVTVLSNLADTYVGTGEMGTAEVYARQAVNAAFDLGKARTMTVADAESVLAEILWRKGDVSEARQLYDSALDLQTEILGWRDLRTLRTADSLAKVLRQPQIRELSLATAMQRNVLEHRIDLLGPNHRDVADSHHSLAVSLISEGKPDQGRTHLDEASRICETLPNRGAPILVEVWHALAAVSLANGDRQEAEQLLRKTVTLEDRSSLASDHNHRSILADLIVDSPGHLAEARKLYAYDIAAIEKRRTQLFGDELDRARYFAKLIRWDPFGGMARALLASDGDVLAQPKEALRYLELGRGRAFLDLLARREEKSPHLNLPGGKAGVPVAPRKLVAAKGALQEARASRLSLGMQLASIERDESISKEERERRSADLRQRRENAVAAERSAQQELYEVIRSEFANQGLRPMTAGEVIARLDTRELLLEYQVGDGGSVVLAVNKSGKVDGFGLSWPDGTAVRSTDLGAAIDQLVSGYERASSTRSTSLRCVDDVASALFPEALHSHLRTARRVFIVADGPLIRLPFEMLPWPVARDQSWIDAGPPVGYGPSATVIMKQRERARQRSASDSTGQLELLAVGDPVFKTKFFGPDPPSKGVVITQIAAGSAAADVGLLPRDVITECNGVAVDSHPRLLELIKKAAIRDAERRSVRGETDLESTPVRFTVWRDGQCVRLRSIAQWPAGAAVTPVPATEALTALRMNALKDDQRNAAWRQRSTDGLFGKLESLPGTRHEVEAIAALISRSGSHGDTHLLLGTRATVTDLLQAMDRPRYLHLATHARPAPGTGIFESALAFTTPDTPSSEDDGFVRLDEILYGWGGRLNGTEMVVLSACQSARGPAFEGEGFVGLTWGFLFAGADSVVASLWRVDDRATALLMKRFYENLLGVSSDNHAPRSEKRMSKAEALHEAKRWLAHATPLENRQRLIAMGFDLHRDAESRDEKPLRSGVAHEIARNPFDFSHPRYWAAFILIGDSD